MVSKQAEKLKSREMKEGWMKNDKGWMKDDEGWMKNEEGWWFQAVEGFWWRTNKRTDICDCRVAFATENFLNIGKLKEKYIEGEGGLFCVIQ